MKDSKDTSRTLWLLKGTREVPGWGPLEADARSGKTDVLIFDRSDGWALVAGEDAPSNYEGMSPESPKNGLYVSENGYPIYVVDCRQVFNARAVVKAAGDKAQQMLDEIGDADTVLQRLGLAY